MTSDHGIIAFDLRTKCPPISTKRVKVPDRKLVDSFTLNSLREARDAWEFLENIKRRMENRNMDITKGIKRKTIKNELLQRLMTTIDEDDDLNLIVNNYWREKAEENEHARFSDKSREAFHFLKKVYKYHEFHRRDGAIINKVVDAQGIVISEEDRVHEMIIGKLENLQVKSDEPVYATPEPFPKLELPSNDEMYDMLGQLSTNKAVAFDGLSDTLFEKVRREEVSDKLKDLWHALADGVNIHPIHFDSRLIPLNKAYPDVPRPEECRPIIVTSPLVKLLEVRMKRKLEKYMVDQLIASQTGFVPRAGIDVNQIRLVNRVRMRTSVPPPGQRKHMFGLFLDFSSAYNTVLHSRLYEKLQKVLSLSEIQMIKAVYSRSRIRLGEYSFTPNIGVAQGSVISPALFNIYCEDLYEDVRDQATVSEEDMLGYADDLLILVTNLNQLRLVIQIIRTWCEENNLKINSKKSGIVEFLPRVGSRDHYLKVGSYFDGFPVVDKYKYLGLWIDCKLTMEPQLDHIREKAAFLRYKLLPLLRNVSLSYRINLWRVFVRPLFEMLAGLFYVDAESNKKDALRLVRKTFKNFTLLSKNIDDETVGALMDFNLEERAAVVQLKAELKWEARKSRCVEEASNGGSVVCKGKEGKDKTIMFPRELQELLNMKTAMCPGCGKPCSSEHMFRSHRTYIPENETLLEKCKLLSQEGYSNGLTRRQILVIISEYIEPFSVYMKNFL